VPSPERTMGVRDPTSMASRYLISPSIEKNFRCKSSSAPPEQIVPSSKGRWGWEPLPRRMRNGTPVKGRWVWALDLDREKLSLQVLYPPAAGEERDCDEGTMGVSS